MSNPPNATQPVHHRRLPLIWLLALLLVSAIVAGVVFLHRPPPAKPAVWASVARSNLVMREACWYPLESTNPFTGWMVDYYPDGRRRSRSAISNGLLNGVCESWYTNGQIQIREHFNDSVSDGLREKWYPNGQRKSEANIAEGDIEGTFRRWYDNGQLAEEIEMKQGKPDGLAWAYYPSGFAKAETHVNSGQVLDRKVWKDGEHKLSD